MPGHDLTRFYALLPLLAAFALLHPTGAQALLTALGILISLKQIQ